MTDAEIARFAATEDTDIVVHVAIGRDEAGRLRTVPTYRKLGSTRRFKRAAAKAMQTMRRQDSRKRAKRAAS